MKNLASIQGNDNYIFTPLVLSIMTNNTLLDVLLVNETHGHSGIFHYTHHQKMVAIYMMNSKDHKICFVSK